MITRFKKTHESLQQENRQLRHYASSPQRQRDTVQNRNIMLSSTSSSSCSSKRSMSPSLVPCYKPPSKKSKRTERNETAEEQTFLDRLLPLMDTSWSVLPSEMVALVLSEAMGRSLRMFPPPVVQLAFDYTYCMAFHGKCVHTINDLSKNVQAQKCLAYAENGELLSAGHDDTFCIHIWDKNGTCGQFRNPLNPKTLDGHTDSVWALVVLSNGQLASGSADNTIRIWVLATSVCRLVLRGHTDSVRALVVLSNGHLASGSADNTARIWNLVTGECEQVLRGHTGGIFAMVALSSGHLISGSEDNTIRIYDINTGECQKVLEKHTLGVRSLTMLSNGQLASGSADNTIRLWNIITGECERVLTGHADTVNVLRLLWNGQLVSGGSDHAIYVWDTYTGRVCEVLVEHDTAVNALAVSPKGILASVDEYGSIRIWR